MRRLYKYFLISGMISLGMLLVFNFRVSISCPFACGHAHSHALDGLSNQTQDTVPFNIDALLQEARRKPGCSEVIKDPKSFWKSQITESKSTAMADGIRMTTAFDCGVLDEEFLRTPPHPVLYPFEKEYLSEPPATSLDGVTSLDKTLVYLSSSSDRSLIKVGDPITVTIVAVDAKGRRKTVGGDVVWVWCVDSAGHNVVTADVQDLGNGTYVASTALRWPGTFRVKVAIAYPREYIRALLHIHRVYKHTRLFVSHFANGKTDESTPCYHNQVIPGGYSKICNLTTINGSPWFCGHPVKEGLTCNDFKGGHNAMYKRTKILPLTPEEFRLIHTPYRSHQDHLVKSQLTVTATSEDSATPLYPRPCGGANPCPLCNTVTGRETWNLSQPSGYLYKDAWYPNHCQVKTYTREECFSNSEWVLLGDSNLRNHYSVFSAMANATGILTAKTTKWHKPMLCENRELDFRMHWEPHTEPFLNGHLLAELGSLVSSTSVIDGLGSDRRYVIILNHFYHISAAHFSSMHVKLLALKDSLVRLFQRNKQAIAMLQSPHISWTGWPEHFGAGDMLGRHIIKMEHEIFSEPTLRDRIIFIPAWEITQALENTDFHPAKMPIISEVIKNYVCARRFH